MKHPIRARATQPERCLIVNADDFGRTEAINRGIIEAHEHGIVRSASLMVSYPAAREAAAYARGHGTLNLGLHLDFSEWRFRDGEWQSVYERVDTGNAEAVRNELRRQVTCFHELIGRAPTHLDSHQHAHMTEPVRSIVLEHARRQGLPVRGCDERMDFCGSFYGQTAQGEPLPEGITAEKLMSTIDSLRAGWTELGCHPGYAGDWDTDYAREREQELSALCDSRLLPFLADAQISLRSFDDFIKRAR